jgi:hypothetical protein
MLTIATRETQSSLSEPSQTAIDHRTFLTAVWDVVVGPDGVADEEGSANSGEPAGWRWIWRISGR